MSEASKPKRRETAFSMNRRALFGAAAAAGGLGAAGLSAGAAPARVTASEPDLTDATANAPGYSGQPRRAANPQTHADPLDLALKG